MLNKYCLKRSVRVSIPAVHQKYGDIEDKAKQLRDIHERGNAAQMYHVPPLARLAAHSQAVRANRRLDLVALCAGSSDHVRSGRANGRATHREHRQEARAFRCHPSRDCAEAAQVRYPI